MDEAAAATLRARLEGLFLEELQDNLRVLTHGLAQLEGGPSGGADAAVVQELFRAAHSLKGAAHSAGITKAVEPCRRLEQVLATLRSDPGGLGDDALRSFAADIGALTALEQEMSGGSGSARAPAADAPAGVGPDLAGSGREVRARVAVDALDALVHHAGDLLSATQRLGLVTARLVSTGDVSIDLSDAAQLVERDLSRAATHLSETAQQLRLQPVSDVTAGLDNAVRGVSRATGKEARLVVEGGQVQLDRDVGDAIREPLLHLVRNAVDHGLELPPERAAAGKRPVGTVTVEASAVGGRVRLVVGDDGAGVDLDGLRTASGTTRAASEDLLELAFLPGVSTAQSLSDVSGRGVGLDAVRSRVESLGGTVQLRSGPGTGTEVALEVPMTLALVRIALVTVAGEVVGLPVGSVRRARRMAADELPQVGGRQRVVVGGEAVAAVPLGAALGLPEDPAGEPPGIVIEVAGDHGALLVDGVEGELEALLQGLPPVARSSAMLTGSVVLPSGRVVLVVNPSACLRAATSLAPARPVAAARAHPTVLLAEDTLTTRALEHSVLEGAGYQVVDAVDGAHAWELLAERHVDVIVSDVEMPRMSGIELCRAVRASPRLQGIPVVLVTAMAADEDVRRGVEAGANAYLIKSAFDQAALLEAVERLL